MDVTAWLQHLGLERYVPAFLDNEIDWEVLPKLTALRIDLVGTTADFRRFRPPRPLQINHLPCENCAMLGRIGEDGLRWDQRFESAFLQRRVYCEPDSGAQDCGAEAGPRSHHLPPPEDPLV